LLKIAENGGYVGFLFFLLPASSPLMSTSTELHPMIEDNRLPRSLLILSVSIFAETKRKGLNLHCSITAVGEREKAHGGENNDKNPERNKKQL
jgi:hypothetical protein